MDREIRMKGKGTLHFVDEQRRPREIKGTIIVDYRSLFQAVFVKVEMEYDVYTNPPTKGSRQFLLPFSQVTYIEWDIIEQ